MQNETAVPQGMWAKMNDIWVVRVPVQLSEDEVKVVRKDGTESSEKVSLDVAWTDGVSFLYPLSRDAIKFASFRVL